MTSVLFDFVTENILDARLIEQFERCASAASSTSTTGTSSTSSTSASDASTNKKGQKIKAAGQKKKQEEEKEKDDKNKAPAFMMPTASGRTPKVTNRYEEKPPEPKNKSQPAGNNEKAVNKAGTNFEKSVRALEKDLKLLPQPPPAKKIKKEMSDTNFEQRQEDKKPPIKKETIRMKEEQHLEDEDDSSSEEEEEKIQYTEWFPPDTWSYLEKVFVTDVTVDDVTVTMRESRTPEGFFSQPTSV